METDRIKSPHRSKWRFAAFFVLAILLSLAATLPFATTQYERREFYFFDVDLTSDHPGITQLFFDVGRGVDEADSSVQPLKVVQKSTRYRYLLPVGTIKELRFDFNNAPGKYSFAHAKIKSLSGQVLHEFSPADFHADNQIKTLSVHDQWINVETEETAHDPYIYLRLDHPIQLKYGWREAILISRRLFLSLLGGISLLAFLADWMAQKNRSTLNALLTLTRANPKFTFSLLAAFSVILQLHPVVFSGKSFASPNSPAFLLYDFFPTLPGYTSTELEDQKGSDVGAFLYQHIHYPALQRRALLKDHELPLWNRYVLGGTPLLGQGQTMFGEILNFIPLLANSAAWAWDLKFILARWIFACSLAFFVWRATSNCAAANVIALTASWIGFFAFRQNHPAQFAVCFGPLILAAWGLLANANGKRQSALAGLALLIANWEVMTSGTVKEAYITLLCLNFAGLLYLLSRAESFLLARAKIVVASVTGLILIFISAPLWWIFLDTLRISSTSYDVPLVNQTAGWQLIGLFEDMFYRRFNAYEVHANPSVNIIILLGVAWLLASVLLHKNRPGLAITLAALLPASFAFGIIPASLLLRTPFLANIYHVGNTFSCPLIILLIAGAGVGFADLFGRLHSKVPSSTLGFALAIIGLMVCVYEFHVGHAEGSPFYNGYIGSIGIATAVLVLTLVMRRTFSTSVSMTLIGSCCLLLLWRHGQYNHILFDPYVYNPRVRADLQAHSGAIDEIASLETEPARIAGFAMNLYNGTNQLYFQEGIYGVDAVRNGPYDQFAMAVFLPKVRYWGTANFGEERGPSRGAMDMLNVRYYVDALKSRVPTEGVRKIDTKDLQIFESPTVWPRAFFTNNIVNEGSLANLNQLLRAARGAPFAALADSEASLLTGQNIYRPQDEPIRTTPAHDYKLTTNSTAFTVDAESSGVIVLTEGYYPEDFKVYLNDKPAEYFRVNHAFKGVAITTPGTYEVRFEYWPHHLTAALIVSGFGLLAGVILFVTLAYEKRSIAIQSPG